MNTYRKILHALTTAHAAASITTTTALGLNAYGYQPFPHVPSYPHLFYVAAGAAALATASYTLRSEMSPPPTEGELERNREQHHQKAELATLQTKQDKAAADLIRAQRMADGHDWSQA